MCQRIRALIEVYLIIPVWQEIFGVLVMQGIGCSLISGLIADCISICGP
jgi:hypothetical protein